MQRTKTILGERDVIEFTSRDIELEISSLNGKPWARISEIHRCDQTEGYFGPYPQVVKLNPQGSVKDNEQIIIKTLEEGSMTLDDSQRIRIVELLRKAHGSNPVKE